MLDKSALDELVQHYKPLQESGQTAADVIKKCVEDGHNHMESMGVIIALFSMDLDDARQLLLDYYEDLQFGELKSRYVPFKNEGLSAQQVLKQAIQDDRNITDCLQILELLFGTDRKEARMMYFAIKFNRE